MCLQNITIWLQETALLVIFYIRINILLAQREHVPDVVVLGHVYQWDCISFLVRFQVHYIIHVLLPVHVLLHQG